MGPRGSVFGTVACILPWILVALAAALGGEARAGEPTAPTLLVRADGTGDHATIQEAIDAAVPGAEILVGEGTFEGHLRITKPLSIRGAGFGSTHVTSLLFKRCDLNAVNRSMMPRLRQARTEAERQAVWAAIRAKRAALVRPTVLIEDTEGATLTGLRISGRAEREEGVVNPGEVVAFRRARGSLFHCAVLGSPGRGIAIGGGSDVVVSDCLVAAIWATGIEIGDGEGVPVKARIRDTDVRRCVHECIAIAPGCDDVVVEQCRISLSARHGVRYDDASPTVRRNLIAAHEGAGIYASGDTHAVVEANLVVGNAGEGMSCWFQNADRIRANTFANNDMIAVALAGGSRPVVERNVFFRSFVAVDGLNLARERRAPRRPHRLPIRFDAMCGSSARASRVPFGAARRSTTRPTKTCHCHPTRERQGGSRLQGCRRPRLQRCRRVRRPASATPRP